MAAVPSPDKSARQALMIARGLSRGIGLAGGGDVRGSWDRITGKQTAWPDEDMPEDSMPLPSLSREDFREPRTQRNPFERAEGGELPRIPNPIIAYHGSPHKFDAFDASKIGTGEGAQAYGHGLYFAQNEGVANSYRGEPDLKYQRLNGHMSPTEEGVYDMAMKPDPDWSHNAFKAMRRAGKSDDEIFDAIDKIQRGRGHMYQVAIHADPEQFLDWDKPRSKQHPKIRQFIEHHADARRLTGNSFTKGQLSEPTGQDIFNRMSGLRTPEMQSADIPG